MTIKEPNGNAVSDYVNGALEPHLPIPEGLRLDTEMIDGVEVLTTEKLMEFINSVLDKLHPDRVIVYPYVWDDEDDKVGVRYSDDFMYYPFNPDRNV